VPHSDGHRGGLQRSSIPVATRPTAPSPETAPPPERSHLLLLEEKSIAQALFRCIARQGLALACRPGNGGDDSSSTDPIPVLDDVTQPVPPAAAECGSRDAYQPPEGDAATPAAAALHMGRGRRRPVRVSSGHPARRAVSRFHRCLRWVACPLLPLCAEVSLWQE